MFAIKHGLMRLLAIALLLLFDTAHAQTELATYTGPDREQRLAAGAKKEGELSLYTSAQTDDMGLLTKAFETPSSSAVAEKLCFLTTVQKSLRSSSRERLAWRSGRMGTRSIGGIIYVSCLFDSRICRLYACSYSI